MVSLDSFYIGIYEVTFDEFNCFKEREQDKDESTNPAITYKADAVTRPTLNMSILPSVWVIGADIQWSA